MGATSTHWKGVNFALGRMNGKKYSLLVIDRLVGSLVTE
jgi:hypothetical protein